MPTQEISRDRWVEFFDSFSKRHDGWLVTVEVMGSNLGSQVEAREVSLRGIAVDLKGGGEDKISIMTGKERTERLTHVITAPLRVRLQQTEDGADHALQIESASGTITLLEFRSAVLPETVDGVVGGESA